jgi:hypothetical protein
VAAPSEAFTWKLFEGVRRICRQCGREPLRVKDVGEHRTLYPSRRTEFLCVECQRANVEKATEENRHALGLEDRSKSA